jgi:hypothetical protein
MALDAVVNICLLWENAPKLVHTRLSYVPYLQPCVERLPIHNAMLLSFL